MSSGIPTIVSPDSEDEKIIDIISKCKRDPVWFIDNFCMIDDEDLGIIPFNLWPAQKELIRLFTNEQLVEALKSRQIGISWAAAAWAIWLCLFHTQKNVAVTSYNEDVAIAFVAKSQFIYDNLPLWLKPAVYKRNDGMLHFARWVYDGNIRVLKGRGTKIEAFPHTDRSMRYLRASTIIFDEDAFIEGCDAIMTNAIGSVSTSGGKLFKISTANGMGNNFYKVWSEHGHGKWAKPIEKGKERQYQDFWGWFGGWQTNPARDQEWYEKQCRLLGPDLVKQEFPKDPEEAFLSTGACFFNSMLVSERVKALMDKPYKANRGDIAYDPSIPSMRKPQFFDDPSGPLVVWKLPRENHKYVIGCDVAEGLEKGDNSVFYVKDITTGEHVAEYCDKIAPDQLAYKLRDAGIFYNLAFIGVEANNHGLTTLKYLTDVDLCNYSNIYFREAQDEILPGISRKLGWYTAKGNVRRNLLNYYNQKWRDEDVKIYSVDLLLEMQRFVKDPQGTPAARGYDLDDRVIAAAITEQMDLAQSDLGSFLNEEESEDYRYKQAIDKIRLAQQQGKSAVMLTTERPDEFEQQPNYAL